MRLGRSQLELLSGSAEAIPVADASADAVFVAEAFHKFDDLNSTRFESGEWRRAFAGSLFEELEESRLPNPQTVDGDGLVVFFASMGWIGDLPDEERIPLLREVRSLLEADEYLRHWETRVFWTRLHEQLL